jgi:hypothetical protein
MYSISMIFRGGSRFRICFGPESVWVLRVSCLSRGRQQLAASLAYMVYNRPEDSTIMSVALYEMHISAQLDLVS